MRCLPYISSLSLWTDAHPHSTFLSAGMVFWTRWDCSASTRPLARVFQQGSSSLPISGPRSLSSFHTDVFPAVSIRLSEMFVQKAQSLSINWEGKFLDKLASLLLSKILTSWKGARSFCCLLLKINVCFSSRRTGKVQPLNSVLCKSCNFVKLLKDLTACRNAETISFWVWFANS